MSILALQPTSFSVPQLCRERHIMTKDELIREIIQYETPLDERKLRSYSQGRLEDYLSYLQSMGCKRDSDSAELAKADTGGT